MRCIRGSTRGATRLHKRNYYKKKKRYDRSTKRSESLEQSRTRLQHATRDSSSALSRMQRMRHASRMQLHALHARQAGEESNARKKIKNKKIDKKRRGKSHAPASVRLCRERVVCHPSLHARKKEKEKKRRGKSHAPASARLCRERVVCHPSLRPTVTPVPFPLPPVSLARLLLGGSHTRRQRALRRERNYFLFKKNIFLNKKNLLLGGSHNVPGGAQERGAGVR